ncbi:MAG: YkgJ family cysteine cluster protein, partial [Thermoguttaceae bacterium]
MSLSVHTLPIAEHWDCHHCARCCHGSVIPLAEEDLAKIRSQRWDEHPDFRGQKVVVRRGLLRGQKVLAKRSDGACVFLTDQGRCRIHLDHGPDAKPVVCRLYPLQVVPHEQAALVTLRRSCPSAAAGRGRKLDVERDDIRELLRLKKEKIPVPAAPRLTGRIRMPWKDLERVLRTIAELMTASHYPVVRRLVHTLLFCDALEECDLRRLENRSQAELLGMLEDAVLEEASSFFRDRRPPDRTSAGLVRQS